MSDYSIGFCEDGAGIYRDGVKMDPEEVVEKLKRLEELEESE